MKVLYNLGIRGYGSGIKIASIFKHSKATRWIDGRKSWENKLKTTLSEYEQIWIHTSSFGEYLMVKPLIELLLSEYKDIHICLTFFSPSGFENAKIKNERISKHYLPLDTAANAKKFISIINPSLAIFVKYDFWFNYLVQLQQQQIPTLVFSASLKKEQLYFKSGWGWQKKTLMNISKILVLNSSVNKFLIDQGFKNTEVCGDTRFDQVIYNLANKKKYESIEQFIQGRKCLILGSSWNKEEALLAKIHSQLENLAIIIAPHETSENRILEIEKTFQHKTIRYSSIDNNVDYTDKILIIDSIGLLADIYQYSDIAVIGGGFSGKLHNILEPAIRENVVLFGPHYFSFPEAIEMISKKIAIQFTNQTELCSIIINLIEDNSITDIKEKGYKYILNNKGATANVLKSVNELISHSTTSASSNM